jgi:LysM repeat protein
MKNIAPGLSLKKYKGNKHEQGGIMVNALGNKTKDINKAVAEVEGGEYNYRYNPSNPKDNYILSEQLGIANMAKQADRFKNNDRISYNTRTNLLNKSVKLNEVLKAQQEQSQMQMALGGELNTNPFDKQPPKQKDSDFRKSYQSTPMNVAKMFDPTGISSYPDVAYSIDDYNKGKGSKKDIALNVLGALPIVGKAKGLITLAKGMSKTKRGLNTITKLGDLAGDIERFPLQTMKDLTNNATKPIAKMVNKSSTSLLDFNDVVRNKIVPPLNPNQFSKKSATKSDMLNAGTSVLNIGNLSSDINSISKKQLGGMLKKYKNGSFLLKGSQSIVDSMVANSKQNDTTKIATAPEIKLGTTTAPKLETNPIALPTLPTTTPKTTAEAANTGMQVNTQNEATPQPVIEKNKKNNFKGALSAVAGAVSALGPIGQGVGAAMQLAPYAIDLGKAMFDKTSVQDLQTQGSAMRLPNTTYAKNGGKLNVKPLPKYILGGIPDNNIITENKEPIIDPLKPFGLTLTKDLISAKNNLIPRMQKIGDYSFDSNLLYPASQAIQLQANTQGDYINNKVFMTPDFKTVIKNNDGSYRFFNPQSVEQQTQTTTPVTTTGNNKGKSKSTPVVSDTPTAAEIEKAKKTRAKFNENPLTTLNTIPLPTTLKSNKPGVNNLTTLDVKKEMNIAKKAGLNVKPQPSESESSRLYKAGQNKQKLSEALMYGMAALPSEQIKTITPDYGRGDDAMSRMGLSTEPIRQEMMQGANKALELTRSQVGTAGQLQSRGQSIMSNLSSQLSQSQIQQQQYLNQLRGALAQREDTKSNVLAQSELTAREAKSAERAAKLDQLNNAISQTSAIGAGTMEQASKMSTIENENERFARSQMQLTELANKGVNFKVVVEDGKPVLKYDNGSGNSTITAPSLVPPSTTTNNAATGNNTPSVTPASNAVVPVTTTGTTHTIKKGDTLYAIAKANNTTVSNLVKANGFANDKALLLPGKTIKIK